MRFVQQSLGEVKPTGLRDRDQTLFWLERGITEGSNIVQYLKVHPSFDFIRGDPRFAGLVRRVGLADAH